MDRREFLKSTAAAALLPAAAKNGRAAPALPVDQPMIKPPRLKPGDTVALISPGSGLKEESFERGLKNLESLGLKVRAGRHARGNDGLFSGDEAQRVEDLHWAFSDPEIRGVWCARGGTGVQRLLPLVDYPLLARNPKVFVGFSDITALHVAIHERCGFVTFHGPVAASSFADYNRDHLLAETMSVETPHRIEIAKANAENPSELYRSRLINPGKVRGRLIGGNLTSLVSLCGTPWALTDVTGRILFLEDIDEPPRRIERMLTQLRQSTDLRKLAGIAFGIFDGCVAEPKNSEPPVFDVIKSHCVELGVPAIYGLSIGHIHNQCTLPIGVEAELDPERATITLLEAAVR